jgi:hypothetical protein
MYKEDILEVYDAWTQQSYEICHGVCGLRIRRKIK